MPNGSPKFQGYTPAKYTPSSVDFTMFAAPLSQMQQTYDLTQQVIDEAAFDFSTLPADAERAQQISAEFDQFKEGLTTNLLKDKDYRNAAKELRRLNKIYNSDPEIALYRQRKAQFSEDREIMRKMVEKEDLDETRFKNWEQRVLGEYAEKGGAAYDRSTGSYNSFDSSPRNIDREKELMEKTEELSKAAPSWEIAQDTISGWTWLDADTRERLKTTVQEEWKNKDQLHSELYKHLAQSDYFKNSLRDNARDEYYVNSRSMGGPDGRRRYAEGIIINYLNSIDSDLNNARAGLEKAKTDEEKKYFSDLIGKLEDSKQQYNQEFNQITATGGDPEKLENLSKAIFEADYITGKILGYSGTSADIFDFMKSKKSLTPYTDNVGNGSSGSNKITNDDLENSTVNVVSQSVTTSDGDINQSYSPGEVSSEFAKENFGNKDFFSFITDPEVEEEWLSEIEDIPIFYDVNVQPGEKPVKFSEWVNNDEISEADRELVDNQLSNAKVYHKINKFNNTYNDKIEDLQANNKILEDQVSSATGAEQERIKAEIINNNQTIYKLKEEKEAIMNPVNMYLLETINGLSESDVDYDPELVKEVKSGDFDRAWERIGLESKKRLSLLPQAISRSTGDINQEFTNLGQLEMDRQEVQQLQNQAITPMLNKLQKRIQMVYKNQATMTTPGIAIDDSLKNWTGGKLHELVDYIKANINNAHQGISIVTKFSGDSVETVSPGEEGYPKDLELAKYYGQPILLKTIKDGDTEKVLLQYTNTSTTDADAISAIKKAKNLSNEDWNKLTKNEKDSYLQSFRQKYPTNLIVAVDNTTHYVNGKGISDLKYHENVTKSVNNIIEGERSGYPNARAEELLGNSIHTYANLNLVDGEVQKEYFEGATTLTKMMEYGNKNGKTSLTLEHQPATFKRNEDGSYTGFKIVYAYNNRSKSVDAQIYQVNLDESGQLLSEGGEVPYTIVNLSSSNGGYAQNMRALDLMWGTGPSRFIPSLGKQDVIPAFTSIDLAKRLSQNLK